MLIKKVKSQTYNVIKAFITESRDTICIKSDSEIRELKNSDISIMDLSSTGSSISKYNVDDVFIKSNLIQIKDDDKSDNQTEEVVIEPQKEIKELSMDDFLDDFKL